jgi:hypothetical protein
MKTLQTLITVVLLLPGLRSVVAHKHPPRQFLAANRDPHAPLSVATPLFKWMVIIMITPMAPVRRLIHRRIICLCRHGLMPYAS